MNWHILVYSPQGEFRTIVTKQSTLSDLDSFIVSADKDCLEAIFTGKAATLGINGRDIIQLQLAGAGDWKSVYSGLIVRPGIKRLPYDSTFKAMGLRKKVLEKDVRTKKIAEADHAAQIRELVQNNLPQGVLYDPKLIPDLNSINGDLFPRHNKLGTILDELKNKFPGFVIPEGAALYPYNGQIYGPGDRIPDVTWGVNADRYLFFRRDFGVFELNQDVPEPVFDLEWNAPDAEGVITQVRFVVAQTSELGMIEKYRIFEEPEKSYLVTAAEAEEFGEAVLPYSLPDAAPYLQIVPVRWALDRRGYSITKGSLETLQDPKDMSEVEIRADGTGVIGIYAALPDRAFIDGFMVTGDAGVTKAWAFVGRGQAIRLDPNRFDGAEVNGRVYVRQPNLPDEQQDDPDGFDFEYDGEEGELEVIPPTNIIPSRLAGIMWYYEGGRRYPWSGRHLDIFVQENSPNILRYETPVGISAADAFATHLGITIALDSPTSIRTLRIKAKVSNDYGLAIGWRREGQLKTSGGYPQQTPLSAGYEIEEELEINDTVVEIGIMLGAFFGSESDFIDLERLHLLGYEAAYPPPIAPGQSMDFHMFFKVGPYETLRLNELYMFRLRRGLLDRVGHSLFRVPPEHPATITHRDPLAIEVEPRAKLRLKGGEELLLEGASYEFKLVKGDLTGCIIKVEQQVDAEESAYKSMLDDATNAATLATMTYANTQYVGQYVRPVGLPLNNFDDDIAISFEQDEMIATIWDLKGTWARPPFLDEYLARTGVND